MKNILANGFIFFLWGVVLLLLFMFARLPVVYSHGHADSLIEESIPKSKFDNPTPDNTEFTYSKTPMIVAGHAKDYDIIKSFWMLDDDNKMVLVFWMAHRSMANQVATMVHSDAIFKGRHYLSVKRFTVLDPNTNKVMVVYNQANKGEK
tara:strand:- start:277 stop:723 length:447 start_codon:yes stop_codon:yes gene_type:complete